MNYLKAPFVHSFIRLFLMIPWIYSLPFSYIGGARAREKEEQSLQQKGNSHDKSTFLYWYPQYVNSLLDFQEPIAASTLTHIRVESQNRLFVWWLHWLGQSIICYHTIYRIKGRSEKRRKKSFCWITMFKNNDCELNIRLRSLSQ